MNSQNNQKMYLQPELKMLRIEIKLIYSKVPDTKNTYTANKYHQTYKDLRKKIVTPAILFTY